MLTDAERHQALLHPRMAVMWQSRSRDTLKIAQNWTSDGLNSRRDERVIEIRGPFHSKRDHYKDTMRRRYSISCLVSASVRLAVSSDW